MLRGQVDSQTFFGDFELAGSIPHSEESEGHDQVQNYVVKMMRSWRDQMSEAREGRRGCQAIEALTGLLRKFAQAGDVHCLGVITQPVLKRDSEYASVSALER